ncbi:MAG: long-chain fatty acid--CoA ligase [Lachnospiraceae bacterium]|nr:long-chain fatty acid--CoA ligase [Lachnospiraceae bacterium]
MLNDVKCKESVKIVCENGEYSYNMLKEYIDIYKNRLYSLGLNELKTVAVIIEKSYLNLLVTCVLIEFGCIILYIDSNNKFLFKEILAAYQPDYIIACKEILCYNFYKEISKLVFFEHNMFIYQLKKNSTMWKNIINNDMYNGSFVFFTSGTSQMPKAVLRTRNNIMHDALHNIQTFSITQKDIIVCAVAFNHVYGFGSGVMPYLFAGSKIIFVNPFTTTKKLTNVLIEKQATIFVGLPIHYKILLESDITQLEIRLALSAGSSLSTDINTDFYKKFGVCINNMYGMSETGAISTYYNFRKLADGGDNNCGTPLKGVKVMCRDIGEGNEYGVINVCSDSVSDGYIMPFSGEIKAIKDKEGWYGTNDIGYIDANNCIHIKGRIENIFSISGKKINSETIEKVVKRFPGIEEAVVIGQKDDLKDTVLIVYIVQNDTVALDELKSFLYDKLPSYCIPKEYYIIEKIPKSKNGKILKNKLMIEKVNNITN